MPLSAPVLNLAVCIYTYVYIPMYIYRLRQITPLGNDVLRDSPPLVHDLKSYSM